MVNLNSHPPEQAPRTLTEFDTMTSPRSRRSIRDIYIPRPQDGTSSSSDSEEETDLQDIGRIRQRFLHTDDRSAFERTVLSRTSRRRTNGTLADQGNESERSDVTRRWTVDPWRNPSERSANENRQNLRRRAVVRGALSHVRRQPYDEETTRFAAQLARNLSYASFQRAEMTANGTDTSTNAESSSETSSSEESAPLPPLAPIPITADANSITIHADMTPEPTVSRIMDPLSPYVRIVVLPPDNSTDPIPFKIRRTTPLERLMDVYCRRTGRSALWSEFMFGDARLLGKQTPEELGVEKAAVIRYVELGERVGR
ncbi:SUMO family protein SMT3 [Spizellomyces punctatus DAOM BR117]|uniref:Rad60/SUMO-like domain-containing protein n=1 Tax=Spizellomyces punctatus (strain DAOM BR117) TaxID=645134 RepID=A0A0L0HKH5_SPIPD|nr:SUMO family protein SMT3 [Spizellomyces punctatus DAOM BR117]KND01971.1 hypothetical protein SPPG_02478 [Spizellomyces punctatus DAOM BR117]|eukprot:XP_016610010.1 hypothetical protein SPPG_02478 [Spizellomyces punctatus DAOM BR117]